VLFLRIMASHKNTLLKPSRASVIAVRLSQAYLRREGDSLWWPAEKPGPDRISESTVARAVRVQREGTAALRTALEDGRITVNAAWKLLSQPADVQDEYAAHPELLRRPGRPKRNGRRG
jgi:hypothetical protein